jgi:hypothetical protein
MTATALQKVAAAVVRQAQRKGPLLPEHVRAELVRAGEPDHLWKDVLALARPFLSFRDGRYHFVRPASPQARQEQEQQQRIRDAVEQILAQHPSQASGVERREQDRTEFVQPVRVRTEAGDESTHLSRDLSPAGIRLVGNCRLLGQKVRVQIASAADRPPVELLLCVLWTSALGDGLFENGGRFLDVPAGQ